VGDRSFGSWSLSGRPGRRWARRSRPGAPGPTPRRGAAGSNFFQRRAHLTGWPAWVHHRAPGVVVAAVPDHLARLSGTRALRSVATQPAVVPIRTPAHPWKARSVDPDRTRACRHGQPERPARCSGVRIAPIKPLFPRVAGAPAGPQPVEWHPTVTVSSENGVPPRRGRPPAQPRGSVVNPSRPPHEARSRPNPRTPSTGPGPVWVAGWPRPGTARPPVVPPPDEHPVRTGGDRLPQQPGCVPRNVVST